MAQVHEPRVAAEVALALLEAMKSTDSPAEVLEDEDLRRTMPRRLGLSSVVDTQIGLFRQHVKQGRRLQGDEFAEFLRLVMKRPDSATVFFAMGSGLAANRVGRVRGWMPRALRLRLVKKRVRKALEKLFGRRLGGFVAGAFVFEMSASPLVQVDASGDACEIITGFCHRALADNLGPGFAVEKQSCETNGDRACRWEAQL